MRGDAQDSSVHAAATRPRPASAGRRERAAARSRVRYPGVAEVFCCLMDIAAVFGRGQFAVGVGIGFGEDVAEAGMALRFLPAEVAVAVGVEVGPAQALPVAAGPCRLGARFGGRRGFLPAGRRRALLGNRQRSGGDHAQDQKTGDEARVAVHGVDPASVEGMRELHPAVTTRPCPLAHEPRLRHDRGVYAALTTAVPAAITRPATDASAHR